MFSAVSIIAVTSLTEENPFYFAIINNLVSPKMTRSQCPTMQNTYSLTRKIKIILTTQ